SSAASEVYKRLPFVWLSPPDCYIGGRLMPRGMARGIDVERFLTAVAAGNPSWRSAIRVYDPILSARNSHIYIIDKGKCHVEDSWGGHLDLDVSVDVLTDIAFSSPAIGSVMEFPSVRPMISLMLD
ncbi:MAG: hypothetical protein K2K92_09095, partial [Duncaniella sp.]|nr:hypothetical protein [Duncaniella sp.]